MQVKCFGMNFLLAIVQILPNVRNRMSDGGYFGHNTGCLVWTPATAAQSSIISLLPSCNPWANHAAIPGNGEYTVFTCYVFGDDLVCLLHRWILRVNIQLICSGSNSLRGKLQCWIWSG